MIAIIERHVDGGLGAGKQQSLLFRIFSNHVYLSAGALIDGQTVDDARPGLSAVVRAIDVMLLRARRRTTTKSDVGKHVGRIDIVVPGLDSDEARTCRKISEVRDVVPGLTTVHRVVDLSVGAARPDDALLNCRD